MSAWRREAYRWSARRREHEIEAQAVSHSMFLSALPTERNPPRQRMTARKSAKNPVWPDASARQCRECARDQGSTTEATPRFQSEQHDRECEDNTVPRQR